MSFFKKNIASIVLGLIFACGISMLLYPTFANWWNSWNATQVSLGYSNSVEKMESQDVERLFEDAKAYNDELLSNNYRFSPDEDFHNRYLKTLSVDDSSVIGSINIPSVNVYLPIYHGTEDKVLDVGAGHLEGSSLPIGGIGTHTVITGHRGLPSARLFTDLDKLVEGDYVILKVLNETLTYQIDTIRIVEPQEVEGLAIDPDKDLLTLVTCTPYGVNTHRMLLTGHRVENIEDWEAVSDAGQIDTKMVALFIAIPILVGLFIWLMIYYRKPRGDSDEEDKNNSNQ